MHTIYGTVLAYPCGIARPWYKSPAVIIALKIKPASACSLTSNGVERWRHCGLSKKLNPQHTLRA